MRRDWRCVCLGILCLLGWPTGASADERLGFTFIYDLLDGDEKVIGSSRKSYRDLSTPDRKSFEHSNELQLKLTILGMTIEVNEQDKVTHDGEKITALEIDGKYKLPLISLRHIRWKGQRTDSDFAVVRTEGDDTPETVLFPLKDFVTFARYTFDLPPPALQTAKKERQKMPLIDLHEMKIMETPYWLLESKEVSWEGKNIRASGYGFIGKRGQLDVFVLQEKIIWETLSDRVSSRLREKIPLNKP